MQKSGGVAYLSIGTLPISASLATDLCWRMETTPEIMINAYPKSMKPQPKVLKALDENTVRHT